MQKQQMMGLGGGGRDVVLEVAGECPCHSQGLGAASVLTALSCRGLSTLIRPHLKFLFPQLNDHVHSLVALLHPLCLCRFRGCSIQSSTSSLGGSDQSRENRDCHLPCSGHHTSIHASYVYHNFRLPATVTNRSSKSTPTCSTHQVTQGSRSPVTSLGLQTWAALLDASSLLLSWVHQESIVLVPKLVYAHGTCQNNYIT